MQSSSTTLGGSPFSGTTVAQRRCIHRDRNLGLKVSCTSSLPRSVHKSETVQSNVLPVTETLDDSLLNRCHALVLDVSCRPVGVVNWKRAVSLDLLEKVEVLEYYDVCVRSVYDLHQIPAVLRAQFVLKQKRSLKVPCNKRNILVRDGGKCQYCGSKRDLTVDHVLPLSKGGSNDWRNVVTACAICNNQKGNKTLRQLGWKLNIEPKEPSALDAKYLNAFPIVKPLQWKDYLQHLTDFNI